MVTRRFCFAVVALTWCGTATLFAQSKELDTAQIDQITGAKGQMNEEENVYKVSFPREDVEVSVDGVQMPPFMGLTSWAAFKPGMKDGTVMVMGDMVLFQDEVNPAMSVALDSGLAVTALHNHFFYDEPKVYFMHIAGEGTAEKLVAFAIEGRGIPRAGNPILAGGQRAGAVTSGTFSPSLGLGIGMGYVRAELAEPGERIEIDVRGRVREAQIRSKPLYETT